MQRLPTVNDLRVRECYICREEDVYDKPESPPKRWVHPCKCTLVAHEECLLEWIRASENNLDKPLTGILKCPQCGEQYILDSNNPKILRILDVGELLLSKSGTVVTVFTIGAGIVSVGTGIYVLSAGYGAFAVRQFLGSEMYHLVLGEDIENWPLCAFFTLPLIPLSLLLSHTTRFRDTLPLVTLMTLWPSVPRITGAPPGQGWLSFMGLGLRTPWKYPQIREPASASRITSDLFRDLLFSWPPSPFLFNLGLTAVRSTYGRYMERFRRFILGDMLKDGEDAIRLDVIEEFRMEVRIEGGDNEQENGILDAPQEGEEQPVAVEVDNNQAEGLRDDNNVRLVLDGAEEGPVVIDGQPAEPAHVPVRAPNGEQQPVPHPVEQRLEGRARLANPAQDLNQREDGGGNVGGRVRLELTSAVLGNLIGGSLIIPPLASFAGSLLLRLALPSGPNAHARLDFRGYSPYSPRRLLCRFLGVRPPGSTPYYSLLGMYSFPESMPTGELFRALFALGCRALVIGTPAWSESDPVWWRNTIGLGIFYVAKDMLSIWYQYLSHREIGSRRLRDRAFEGIDPSQLDLKPELRGTFQTG